MWITHFRAQYLSPNYSDVDLELAPVNIFLGRNNSGKSRLLQTLVQFAYNESRPGHPDRRDDKSLATNVTVVHGEELPYGNPGLLPYRYIPVDRTPPSALDTRMIPDAYESPRQMGTGVNDLLAELHAYPLFRPILQFEIEHLLGISFSFESLQYNFNWYATDDQTSQKLTLNQHGRGLQYYIALFFYLYHPDIRVLFIDEPENSLHPQLQRALISRVRYVAREQGKQVFLATHSPLLALPDSAEDLRGMFLLQRYHTQPKILPLFSLVPTDLDERRRFESFLPNLDPSIAELFFATGGLIVEGQTERQFMQYIAARTGRDLPQHGVTVIESNGLGLMPGLIRIARPILQHWRAFCDGDLLYARKKSFEGYRNDLGSVLEMPISLMDSGDEDSLRATRSALRARGLFVLPKSGLEEYFISPEARNYFEDHKTVEPQDKGWLLAKEIQFLREKDPDFINATYSDLVRPLDELLAAVEATAFKARTMEELVRDILFSDANRVHCEVYRQKWNEDQLNQFLRQSKDLSAYDVHFRTFDSYELHWRDSLNGRYRIRCEGVWFYVEYATQLDGEFTTLRLGTVATD